MNLIESYRRNSKLYVNCVTYAVMTLLGPFIGFSLRGYLAKQAQEVFAFEENDPDFELPNIILCCMFYATTLFLAFIFVSVNRSQIALSVWAVSYFIFVMGHWLVYVNYEKFRKSPNSKSECEMPYIWVTILSALFIWPIIAETIYVIACEDPRSRREFDEVDGAFERPRSSSAHVLELGLLPSDRPPQYEECVGGGDNVNNTLKRQSSV